MARAALSEEVAYLRELGGLSERDVARATGTGRSTVNAWSRGSRRPTGERVERLAELSALVERLVRVMDAGEVALWLNKPLLALDDEKPSDVRAAGGYRRE